MLQNTTGQLNILHTLGNERVLSWADTPRVPHHRDAEGTAQALSSATQGESPPFPR